MPLKCGKKVEFGRIVTITDIDHVCFKYFIHKAKALTQRPIRSRTYGTFRFPFSICDDCVNFYSLPSEPLTLMHYLSELPSFCRSPLILWNPSMFITHRETNQCRAILITNTHLTVGNTPFPSQLTAEQSPVSVCHARLSDCSPCNCSWPIRSYVIIVSGYLPSSVPAVSHCELCSHTDQNGDRFAHSCQILERDVF